MIKTKIEKILRETFAPLFLEIVDDSAKHAGHASALGGGHFKVSIVTAAFEGKKSIERHRMVYEALTPLKKSIHALSIKATAVSER